ncbi:MAG: chemotaxis protein CheA [Candidatus Cloacimonetes bacterium]|nr:chemotaxis protein CheA [Candidatus Cloacimonadota bacterium]
MSDNIFSFDDELLDDFVNDSRDLLDEVEPTLLQFKSLQNTQDSDENFQILNTVFRLFHSLKGSAGFLGFDNLVNVAHEAETLLDLYRSSKQAPPMDQVDLLCLTCDLVRQMLASIKTDGNEQSHEESANKQIVQLEKAIRITQGHEVEETIEVTEITIGSEAPSQDSQLQEDTFQFQMEITPEMIEVFVQEADDTLKIFEADILILNQFPDSEDCIQEAFREIHSMKGNAGFLGYKDVERVSHKAENLLEDIAEKNKVMNEEICEVLLEVSDILKAQVVLISNGEDSKIDNLQAILDKLDRVSGIEPQNSIQEPIKEDITSKTSIHEPVNEDNEPSFEKAIEKPSSSKQNVPAPAIESIVEKTSVTEKPVPKKPKPKPKGNTKTEVKRQDIRVDLAKLDQLIDLVGELVIAEAMVINNPDLKGLDLENFEKAARHLSKISRDLQDTTLSIRMVPVAATFKKMIRLVHDLERKSHKKIQLLLSGEETEIDKTLIEQVSDPLVHIIRNSADHGIQTPEERRSHGKSETGTISLSAKHEEGEVWIIVEDDGQGLNRNKILQKAIEKDVISADDQLSDHEVWQLVFEPGFSTADQVSDISGRGVGMDVVRRNIEKLKGKIEIQNSPGVGCKMILKIPLTLAIIEGMLVEVGSRYYTVPLLSIRESLKPTKDNIHINPDGQEILSLRDSLIPIVRLHKLHKLEAKYDKLEDGILVIVESRKDIYALFVDALHGQHQTVIKPLSDYVGDIRGVSGCTILGNGDISLILDASTLIQIIQQDFQHTRSST